VAVTFVSENLHELAASDNGNLRDATDCRRT